MLSKGVVVIAWASFISTSIYNIYKLSTLDGSFQSCGYSASWCIFTDVLIKLFTIILSLFGAILYGWQGAADCLIFSISYIIVCIWSFIFYYGSSDDCVNDYYTNYKELYDVIIGEVFCGYVVFAGIFIFLIICIYIKVRNNDLDYVAIYE
jgi:hypothetical protein